MSNSEYLEKMKLQYPSLQEFSIVNNCLVFNNKYGFPLTIILSNYSPNIFMLDADEIFRIFYMLELINKNELSESEIKFIDEYTNKYISLVKENTANNNIDGNRLWALGIPVDLSYDTNNKTSLACARIVSLMNKSNEELEMEQNNTGKGKDGKARVLSNPNFKGLVPMDTFYVESENNNIEKFNDIVKNGFTAICLICGAVLATCAYLLYFFSK